MKKTKMTLALVFALAALTACKDQAKQAETAPAKTETTAATGSASKLEGAWIVNRVDSDPADPTVGTLYTFKGNTLTTSKDGLELPATTEVGDSTFTFLMQGAKEKIVYNYHMAGDTLVAQMTDGPQVFYLTKK